MHQKPDILRAHLHRTARAACIAGLATTLAMGTAPTAWAASSSTEAELRRLTSEVGAATATFREASEKAAELQRQVDELAGEIIRIEQEVLPVRQQLAADAAVNMYKMHNGAAGVVTMLLGADTFSDFIAMNKYLDSIQANNTQALQELNDLRDDMAKKMEELGDAKDEALEQQQVASDALARAKNAQATMASKAAAEDAEAMRQAEAARQEIIQAEQHAQGQGAAPAPQTQQDQGQQPAPQQPAPQQPAPQQGGWKTGVASYYGIGDGFMGGTTANGETVTETSMGIAMLGVPFGTRVEISFRGRSVIAYVNDRGPYVHGRVIDMQPAVARALNFLSVGVGTVQYRFL